MKNSQFVQDLKIGLWVALITFVAMAVGVVCLIFTESTAFSFAVVVASIAFGVRRLLTYILDQYGIST